MKNASIVLKYSLAALFAMSVTMTGCGDKNDAADAADSTKDAAEESAEATGEIGQKIKSGMIDMAKGMIDIAEDVESVEDAEKAEPKIAELMGNLTSVFTDFGDNIDKMTMEDIQELQNMQAIMQDPEVAEWGKKVEASMEKLKTEHPDAAAKLEEITTKQSQKMMEGMMAIGMKIQQKMGGAAGGMGTPAPAPGGDTGAGH